MNHQRPPLPPSLWAATAAPAAETPPLAGDTRAEIAVVGGGFTGLSAALHLAEKGRDVVLVEAGEPGWGASGRNGGQVIAGLKHDPDDVVARFGERLGRRLVDLAGGNADFLFALLERHAIACDADRKGWIQAAHAATALPAMETRVRQWQARGAPVEMLSADETRRLLGTDGYAGGALDRRGGRLQPLSYARGLARAALKAGARIHGGTRALGLARRGQAWRLDTSGGAIAADQVLLATNGYSDDLWPGLKRSVIPMMSYQAATKPLSDNLRRIILPEGHVTSDTRRLLAYYRLDAQGRLVLGGRGRTQDSSDPRFYRHIVSRLAGLFPQLGEPQWEYYWSGRVALTLDHYPHMHELAPGLKAALGYNGRGVAMATRLGAVLADWADGQPTEELPMPVTPMRRIPLHGLRAPAMGMAIAYKHWQDRRDLRRG